MESRLLSPALQRVLALSMVIVIGAAIVQLQALINPLLLATLFFVLSSPILIWLKRIGLPDLIAVFTTLILMIFVLTVTINLMAVSLEDFVRDLPTLFKQFQIKLKSIALMLPLDLSIISLDERILQFSDGERFVGLLTSSLQGLVSTLSNLVVIILLLLFMLLEATNLSGKLAHFSASTGESITKLVASIKRYLLIKSFFSLVTGIMVGGFLWIYGIEYPLLMGAIAFLLNFIPAIGSIIAAIPTLMLVFVNHELIDVLMVLLWYCIVNVSIGNFFEPRQMGKEMGISPLVVFLSLMLWGWMLGPVGMFMAVPLTMVIKIILASNPQTKWIALIMS